MHGANTKIDTVQSKQVRVMKFCTIVYVLRYVHSFGLIQKNKSIKRHGVRNLKKNPEFIEGTSYENQSKAAYTAVLKMRNVEPLQRKCNVK